jgi:selenide,water dikinase
MKQLVLIGGGHAHVEVLRRLTMMPVPDTRVTMINTATHSPYSGMLPGLIAGHYSWDDAHIDVAGLCAKLGATFVHGEVTRVDPAARRVTLASGDSIAWDYLSVNTGSTPDTSTVDGATEHAIRIKPMAGFLTAWDTLLTRARAGEGDPIRAAVVGGGAAGAEVALAIAYRLKSESKLPVEIALVTDSLLPTHPKRVRKHTARALANYGVALHEGERVRAVESTQLTLDDGRVVPTTFTVWCTGASAPAWFAASGLATDERGFLRVDAFLRSTSHPDILGAGDAVSLAQRPVPKAGVYAVRQGPILAMNLAHLARGEAACAFRPQRRFLSLLSLGGKRAVLSWGPFAAEGSLMWTLKDRIDRGFMAKYVVAAR